jgi:hypothetical protein
VLTGAREAGRLQAVMVIAAMKTSRVIK